MKDPEKPNPDTILHIDTEMENGVYANAATFVHSSDEFVLDFIFVLPGDKRKVVARVVTTPAHAKQMSDALRENLVRFEAANGAIKPPGETGRKDLQ